jgi:hypothetical protein
VLPTDRVLRRGSYRMCIFLCTGLVWQALVVQARPRVDCTAWHCLKQQGNASLALLQQISGQQQQTASISFLEDDKTILHTAEGRAAAQASREL